MPGPRGPRPTPTYLKLIRGNPGKRPIRTEPEPTRTAEVPDPPPFLVGYASDEWHRVAPELHRLGLLTLVDVNILAAYCMSYSRWRTAEERLAAMADKDTLGAGLMIRGPYGNATQNPLVRIASTAASEMLRHASEFGLTPVARARIAAGPFSQPQGGKFDGLLG
jgi:P27 family predicted phage terminase small subunit